MASFAAGQQRPVERDLLRFGVREGLLAFSARMAAETGGKEYAKNVADEGYVRGSTYGWIKSE